MGTLPAKVRRGVGQSLLATLTLLLVPAVCAAAEGEPAVKAQDSCTLRPGPTRTVARVLDGETLLLDDGREVRLIGALAPRAEDAGAVTDAWPPETEAIRLLSELVLGRSVRLAQGGRTFDRYGRYLAHVFVAQGGDDLWVQGEMLRRGAARAYGLPGSFECAAELLAHERVARQERRGLWSLRLYQIKDALKTRHLMRLRSRFAIAGGVVHDVALTKSAVYLNFGANWRTDFTARIAKRVLGAHPDFDQRLDALKGTYVEVRGWIERRNGPLIDVADPAQIDVAPAAGPLLSSRRGNAIKPTGAPNAGDIRDGDQPTDNGTQGNQRDKEKRPADPLGIKPGAVDL